MKKLTSVLLVVVGLTMWADRPVLAGQEQYIYKNPNKLDFVKVDKAKKEEKEGGLKHPATVDLGQMKGILSAIHFSKKNLLFKDMEDRGLLAERHVEFLAPFIVEALQKATDNQVVVVSYFTKDSKYLVQNNRLTIFRAFVKDDGLHMRFSKVYAKLLGDRGTKGATRTANEAEELNVSFEMHPGQSWVTIDPKEVLFDLKYDFVRNVAQAEAAPAKKDKKESSKIVNKTKTEKVEKASSGPDETDTVKEERQDAAKAVQDKTSIRQRLKELDALKKEDLITEKEYQKKRQQLLLEL